MAPGIIMDNQPPSVDISPNPAGVAAAVNRRIDSLKMLPNRGLLPH